MRRGPIHRVIHVTGRFAIAMSLLLVCQLGAARAEEDFVEPLFDHESIVQDPLDAETLSREVVDGVVYEEVEYTAEVHEGKPIRIYGIVAYPEGAAKVPGIYWSQSGMYQAARGTPGLFAKKGYFAMVVTLPHDVYDSYSAWDAEDPRMGNMTRLARVQMRGITYMTQRPEVDAERLGVSGSSYGGFFATLLAGADPRIKAGCSFFAAGNLHLGTIRPQFTQLRTREDIDTWLRTIDPAWRLRHKAVPFLWGAAGNDNWDFPASIKQTYVESIGEKRLAIVPYWEHALPENVDQQLWDWFDIYLKETRKPYNEASALQASVEDGKLIGRWNWTGENRVERAELIYTYGALNTFGGWVHRLEQPTEATIEGQSASAEIPVPDPRLPIVVWGNITDENGVVISTVPEEIDPAKLGVTQPTGKPEMIGLPYGDFEPASMTFVERHGWVLGVADANERHGGTQSLRLDAPADAAAPGPAARLKLFHVAGRPHRVRLWMKADAPARVTARVVGVAPSSWQTPAARLLVPEAAAHATEGAARPENVAVETQIEVTREWQQFTVEVPPASQPIEGYFLELQRVDSAPATLWLDDASFTPVWSEE